MASVGRTSLTRAGFLVFLALEIALLSWHRSDRQRLKAEMAEAVQMEKSARLTYEVERTKSDINAIVPKRAPRPPEADPGQLRRVFDLGERSGSIIRAMKVGRDASGKLYLDLVLLCGDTQALLRFMRLCREATGAQSHIDSLDFFTEPREVRIRLTLAPVEARP